jgi:Ca2+-transporting ATPase
MDQLTEPLTLLLIGAAAVSGLALAEPLDAVAILAIVVLNVVIALVEEGRAGAALDALRQLESPQARVRRGGRVVVIPAREVVPGDVVLVAAGDRVPADVTLHQAGRLEADEAILTGESLPVEKHPPLATGDEDDGETRLLSGTLVTAGTGEGVVTATGANTALGRIAAHVQAPQPPTPLQRELAGATAWLGTAAVVVAIAVFGLVLATTEGPDRFGRAFLSAVALAVAAVPEGLSTVTAVALALGVRRMAGRGAIVRRLTAVETLGSATVLVADKTGTLTENRLRLATVTAPGLGPVPLDRLPAVTREAVERVAVLCNDAVTEPRSGDPVDVALLDAVGAERTDAFRAAWPRTATVPFDSAAARMRTVHRGPEGSTLIAVKGAPEAVLRTCRYLLHPSSGDRAMTDTDRAELLAQTAALAVSGAKVLALAHRLGPILEGGDDHLVLVGLVALRDPVRLQAAESVAAARAAGIRLVMATGDHPGTAASVAGAVGLTTPGEGIVTGADLRAGADPGAANVYARVDPDQKLALVKALRADGHVVAMTGDGVNDAPALRQADIGVALGGTGTEVAREAADLVVTDDDLATIVEAVRQGRGIYDNVRKVVDYLVAGNVSEIVLVLAGLIAFGEAVLLPLQLLWVNLLTDGAPALALGVDPVDADVLSRAPRPSTSRLLGRARLSRLAVRGGLLASAPLLALGVASGVWHQPWAEARTLAFTVLVVTHLLYSLVLSRWGRNPWLLAAVAGGLALQLVAVCLPAARAALDTTALDARDWALVAALPPIAVMGVGAAMRVTVGRVTARRPERPAADREKSR